MFLFIYISTAYIMKFYIYLCPKFLFVCFRATFCFSNPDYRLIRMTSPPLPQLLRISEGLLYVASGRATR
jgi:hypothetical protein